MFFSNQIMPLVSLSINFFMRVHRLKKAEIT